MKRIAAPSVEPRQQDDILDDFLAYLVGYTRNWHPKEGAAGTALMHIFAGYIDILSQGLNALPQRHLLAFLDSLGIGYLPAQAARAPLVFTLLPNGAANATLPANSQFAAPPQPVLPSPLQPRPEPTTQPQPALFATEQTVTLSKGKLTTLYSIQPGSDLYADHTAMLTDGFTLFGDMQPSPHVIYLGHDELFKLAGDINIILHFSQHTPATREIKITWEYLTDMGWLPLESLAHEDTTLGLTEAYGQMVLRRFCGPDAKEIEIDGCPSYWLRGRLTTSLPPQGKNNQLTAPLVDTISVTVQFDKDGLQPEAAFADTSALDTSKDFYPFGSQPTHYSTFYLANEEVFQRKGARVRINLELSDDVRAEGNRFRFRLSSGVSADLETSGSTIPSPIGNEFHANGIALSNDAKISVIKTGSMWQIVDDDETYYIRLQADGLGVYDTHIILVWEYYNGKTWAKLGVNDNYQFTDSRIITFTCPRGWAETTVNGVDSYWLRVRILEGNYGQPLQATTSANGPREVILTESTLKPPVVSSLTLGYAYQTDVEDLDYCITYNDFVCTDHSNECRWRRRTFQPFQPVSDRQPAVHFAFDKPLPPGLLSLFVHVPYSEDTAVPDASPYIWEYRTERGWPELSVLDETFGFQRSGMIQFIGPRDVEAADGLGDKLYRIRARLKRGEQLTPAPIEGVWLNAVWSTHRQAFKREILGQSDGNPYQAFLFPPQRTPVLEGEEIEVREWAALGRGWEVIVRDIPEDDIRKDRDPATDEVRAVWVRWHQRPHLFDATPNDRVYVLERATGWLGFGDGQRGMVPPAGARIVASYDAGGGTAGNVEAHSVNELRTAVSGIMGVTNPIAAAGGAAVESIESVKLRGPQRVRHHGRAVSPTDFEWLAYESSPEVARARCLPLLGSDGKAQRGWVTMVIVPYAAEDEARPWPTPELMRRVRESLSRHVPATVVGQIRLVGPTYVPVSVQTEIVPIVPSEAAQVEERTRRRLANFLHPLTGGPEGDGWDFGHSLHLSQIASVIENTPGVDYAREIILLCEGEVFDETAHVDKRSLLASGRHEILLALGGG